MCDATASGGGLFSRTPTHCPHCGFDGGFDGMGSFTRKTATKRLGESGTVEKWEKWYRVHCPDCGEHFALLEKTVRIPYDENGNEVEAERELVTDRGEWA